MPKWVNDPASLADVVAGSTPCAGPTNSDDENDVASTVSLEIQVLRPYWLRSAVRLVPSGRKELVAWSRALSAALASQEGRLGRVQRAEGGEEEVEAKWAWLSSQTSVGASI